MATEIPMLRHLQMDNRGIQQDYKSKPGRGKTLNLPPRNRATHGNALSGQLNAFVPISQNLALQRAARNLDQLVPEGIVIEFQSRQGFDLAFERLDLPSVGIELLNFREIDNVKYATCYVPEGQLGVLIKKVKQYIEEDTRYGKPKNKDLIESIQSIGLATIEAYWTDEVPPPEDDTQRWWEIWLRREDLEPEVCLQRFTTATEVLGLRVAQTWLAFPDRVVANLQATRSQLAEAVDLLNLVAEIRRSDIAPALPDEPSLHQQDAFVGDLSGRLQMSPDTNVVVSLLDTGVNRNHPLLAQAIDATDQWSVNPAWGVHDHHGHGTQMAGVTLYGDLRTVSGGPIQLVHKLESVKILPPQGETPEELFGALTEDAVYLTEIHKPNRERVFCKTVTSPMHQDGLPSSYSAAVDQLAYGADDESPRLFVVSAGNVPEALWREYPNSNLTYGVEQPGQAWNALTVGACTDMDTLPGGHDWIGWNPLAEAGDLSPFSATSYPWARWPIKPEVLFEGGNVAVDAHGGVDTPKTMQLITTHHNLNGRPLSHTNMTSPATAQCAGFAAKLMAEYPEYWPETIKALIVHSADWTAQMRARFLQDGSADGRLRLLRACGWGQPRLDVARQSGRNRVCVVVQDTIQPYKLVAGSGKMNEMKIFALPWPKKELAAIANTPVRLRVTLCYFVEPSPSKRGWVNRYRYSSHALRFDLRRNNETEAEFNKRVNAAMLEKEEKIDAPANDGWFLRGNLRTRGSIHSDEWSGMAINLMSRDLLAVYPVVGWWRESPERGHCEDEARFALLFTLEAQDEEIDLYEAIRQEVNTPIEPDLLNLLG